MRWLLHKYKCLWSVGRKGQDLSLQEGASHTYTLKLGYSRILSCIQKKKKKKKKYITNGKPINFVCITALCAECKTIGRDLIGKITEKLIQICTIKVIDCGILYA